MYIKGEIDFFFVYIWEAGKEERHNENDLLLFQYIKQKILIV